jgi:cytochrome c biogenesis protein CcmG, thiol:disulfide interchange protein DsbE
MIGIRSLAPPRGVCRLELTDLVRGCILASMCGKTANAGNAQAMGPRLATSPLIFILIILWGLSGTVRGEDAPLQIRLEKALENARAITNVEIHYDDFLWIKGRPESAAFTNDYARKMQTKYIFDKDFTRTMHVSYIASGVKYRSESQNESAQTTNLIKLQQTAFDGKLWAAFSSSSDQMVEQDGDMPGGDQPFCPLVLPLLFLSRASEEIGPNSSLRFTDLRDPDILDGLILPTAEDSGGTHQFSFPGLPRDGVRQLWSITFGGADPDFRPEKISVIGYGDGKSPSDMESTYLFSDYTNIGAYYFPARMAYTVFNASTNHLQAPTLSLTGLVTVVSVKLPTQIPEGTFRLDESKAAHIWNTGETKGYGVGLILGEAGSNVVVKRIYADSPAGAQNVIKVGDRVLSIAEADGADVPVHVGNAELPRAVALLRGAKGTAVRLTFLPSGNDGAQTQVVTLVRAEVRGRLGGGSLLTSGMKAPDIEMVALTNRAAEHLSDYAGKIVVLEFWASWCSPCQKSMADLQLDSVRFPAWKDKVVVIAASVDDTADIAAKHIRLKGWDQTHNVWLATKDIRSYHVGAIPSAYVIDAKGSIVASGISMEDGLNIPEIVNRQLDDARKE